MAIALVNSAIVNGGGNITTSAVDTTGATVLVVTISFWGPESSRFGSITDSKGNTWTQRSSQASSGSTVWVYVAENPVVGSGHTATLTVATGAMYTTMVFGAFSGTTTSSTYDKQASATTGTNTSVAPGSSGTPTVANSLIVAGYSTPDSSTGVSSAPSGFSLVQQMAYSTGTSEGGGMYWKESSVAENPTFTGWSAGSGDISAAIVVLKGDGSGGGGSPTPVPLRSLLGVGR